MQVPFFCYYSGFVAEDFRVCLSRGHCEKQIVGIDVKFVRLGLTWNCEWNNSEPNSAISCQGAWRFFSLSYSVFRFYLNNRVLLSRALSCDRLPEEILCLQQVGGLLWSLNINFPGNLSLIGPGTEGLYCVYCTTLNFEQKLPKTGTLR